MGSPVVPAVQYIGATEEVAASQEVREFTRGVDEGPMADLEFIGTPEERQRQVESVLRRLFSDIHGNGRPGIMELVRDFISGHDAREDEREKAQKLRHQENAEKLNEIMAVTSRKSLIWTIAGVLVAFAAIIATIVFGIIGYRLAHSEAIPFHITDNQPVLSSTQHASDGIPTYVKGTP